MQSFENSPCFQTGGNRSNQKRGLEKLGFFPPAYDLFMSFISWCFCSIELLTQTAFKMDILTPLSLKIRVRENSRRGNK